MDAETVTTVATWESEARALADEALRIGTTSPIAAKVKLNQAAAKRGDISRLLRQRRTDQDALKLQAVELSLGKLSNEMDTFREFKAHRLHRDREQQRLNALALMATAAPFQRKYTAEEMVKCHRKVIDYYEGSEHAGPIRDMVTDLPLRNESGHPDSVVAVPLYQRDWQEGLLAQTGLSKLQPENFILTSKPVEARLRHNDIILLPVSPGQLELRVLNPALLTRPGQEKIPDSCYIYTRPDGYVRDRNNPEDMLLWDHFNRQPFKPRNGKLPDACLSGLHAVFAIKEHIEEGHMKPGEVAVSESAWERPSFKGSLLHHLVVEFIAFEERRWHRSILRNIT
ncbi:g5373 [Coccomyxa viridis]|uniref:G5373 protein n=1 Tax=Coccomyxa viridis TaxID=1274662 RepID=A0ABP1FSN6_9CHLO